MKMIKVLQIAVVAMFVLMVVTGVLVLALASDKMKAYESLVHTLFGVLLTMVVPALIGSPLTDAVRNLSAAKAAKIAGTSSITAAGDGGR